MAADKQAWARSFDAAVAAYTSGRPSYPEDAVRFLIGTKPLDVVDLGAGSGKLTGVLVAEGHRVTAVEPLDGMRAALQAALPAVRAIAGSAERIPLPDAVADAVLVAQAWHWFDPIAASAEVARILRPGGVLGLLWNIRDTTPRWAQQFAVLLESSKEDMTHEHPAVVEELFEATGSTVVSWSARASPQALLDLVASRSYFITKRPKEQQSTLARVRNLVPAHPDLRDHEEFDMPYRTWCWRYASR